MLPELPLEGQELRTQLEDSGPKRKRSGPGLCPLRQALCWPWNHSLTPESLPASRGRLLGEKTCLSVTASKVLKVRGGAESRLWASPRGQWEASGLGAESERADVWGCCLKVKGGFHQPRAFAPHEGSGASPLAQGGVRE